MSPQVFDKVALQVVAIFSLMGCLDGQGNESTSTLTEFLLQAMAVLRDQSRKGESYANESSASF